MINKFRNENNHSPRATSTCGQCSISALIKRSCGCVETDIQLRIIYILQISCDDVMEQHV